MALGAGLAAVGATAVWWFATGSADDPMAGRVKSLPEESRAHIPEGQQARYQTDPPTSGPHYDGVLPTGFYDRPAPDELVVHNLEHGQIVVYYDPERASDEALDDLKSLAARYPGEWDGMVVLPREGLPAPYVLTAWRHMAELEAYDPSFVRAFLDTYRGRGPERRVR